KQPWKLLLSWPRSCTRLERSSQVVGVGGGTRLRTRHTQSRYAFFVPTVVRIPAIAAVAGGRNRAGALRNGAQALGRPQSTPASRNASRRGAVSKSKSAAKPSERTAWSWWGSLTELGFFMTKRAS